MKYISTILFFAILSTPSMVSAQGCVAVRNMAPGAVGFNNPPKTWQMGVNYRFFHSYKHFVGTEEQTHRVEEGTEVINNDQSLILAGNYTLDSRWSFAAAVPVIYIDRSSMYEHYGNSSGQRFHTQSMGLGDLRLLAFYTLVNKPSFRLITGLGIKLPTGNYAYKDEFHKRDSNGQDSLVTNVVDQSIQPGDGGTGAIVEFNLFKVFSERWSMYSNGSYLFNPRNTNGVKRNNNPTTIPLSNEFSVSDQYFARLGAQYMWGAFAPALGARIEGIPSKDLIGSSDGFRRPGYIVSIEPSVYYGWGNHLIGLNVPVAVVRNRTQSQVDKIRSAETGTKVHGDAAFADYLISVGYSFTFARKASSPFGKQEVELH
jgi:hypothetical protein